jgi:copper chaperone CopZ
MKKIVYLAVLLFLLGCQQSTSSSSEEKKQETQAKGNKTLVLQVEGMTCTGCENAIENNIKGINGVVMVEANHKEGTTTVEFDSTLTDKNSFVTAIKSSGYQLKETK